MKIPNSYSGREQSYVKHQLLRGYLERLIMIVGHKRASRFCYVDCFAGPWPDEAGGLSDTSVGISMEIMRRCKNAYTALGKGAPTFRALFIEKDATRFKRLQNHLLHTPTGIETHALRGAFNTLHDEILDWCGPNDFTFFFIDPKGWKDVSMTKLRPLLERPNSEFLVNLMYDFVNRAVPQQRFVQDMQELFGEHMDIAASLVKRERERALLSLYQERLRQAVPATGERPYTASVRIMDPYKNRTKYHLVYLTRHPKGIYVFMEQSEKLDLIQPQVRAQAQLERRIRRTGAYQGEFTLDIPHISIDEFDKHVRIASAKEYWLSKLGKDPQPFGLAQFADMVEETGCFIGTMQTALGELIAEGRVKNIDATRLRPKNHVIFDRDERLVRM